MREQKATSAIDFVALDTFSSFLTPPDLTAAKTGIRGVISHIINIKMEGLKKKYVKLTAAMITDIFFTFSSIELLFCIVEN